jgi:hypothetical protein
MTFNHGCGATYRAKRNALHYKIHSPLDKAYIVISDNTISESSAIIWHISCSHIWSQEIYLYSENNDMHFLFCLLRIKGLYMFWATLARPQEVLHKWHLVYCVCVMSAAPSAAPPAEEQVMLKTFLINWIKSASRWFQYTIMQLTKHQEIQHSKWRTCAQFLLSYLKKMCCM